MMNSYFILCLVTFTIQIKAMFYINTRKNPGPIKQKQLLDAMLVPPEERLTKDHRVIYRFFIGNEMLKQIERTKSLNARIKCVAALLLISRQDFVPEQHIIMYVFEDQRAIILPKQAKASAQAFNQKLIRRKMDLIGTFSIMQSLKYDQLLYLAFNMEQISCIYKDYLYREGQVPQFFYLIVEGQFHYVKDCNQHQAKIKLNKKDKNKSKQLKSIEQEDQNPNKYVKSHINRYKIGIVEGKLGQAVGLEEIMLEEYKQARKYSVICNSTENKCVKIHKKYVQTLFQELPYFQQLIYNQIRGANNAKIQLLKRIKITKFHLKQNMNKSIQKSNKHQERYQQVEMRSLQNRAQSLSKLKLPTLHMKSSINYDYNSKDRSRAYSSALAGSLKSQQNHVKSLKSQQYIDLEQAEEQKQQEQDEGSFALTSLKVQSNKKPVKSPSKEDLLSQSYRTAQVRESFQVKNFDPHFNLPLIGKKSVTDIQGSSISLKHIIKIKQKSKMNQYGGMVDCSKLIEEKQDIFERKNNKITREQIFPIGHIEYRQPRKISMEDPMKLKASPAHSNRFMQKMLLKVLKRAGYDEAGKDIIQPKQQNLGNITVNVKPVTNQFHKSLSKHKRRQSNQHKNVHKQQLLVNSAFDECYFAKI